jgi:cysteine desulfurase
MRVYFDNAATTPLDPLVIETMAEAMRENFGNPSSIHAEGRKARAAIEQARKAVARSLNASIGEIFFTSGGTEANNTALKGAVRDLGVTRIISARTEHHCVLHSLDSLEKWNQVQVDYVKLDAQGRVDVDHLRQLLAAGNRKTMVSLMHANNEMGAMINLAEISALCREQGVLFHTDTVQTMGFYPIDLTAGPVSFLSGSAHKFHGPKGVGFIYINSENNIGPYIDGGAQERNMRGGTENLYGILGLARALELACDEMEARRAHIKALRDYLREQLTLAVPRISFNGDPDTGHYKILSASFPPSEKADLLLFNLDIAGISASGGSACSSGADAGSHVIAALHPDSDRKTVRFSLSHLNTRDEVDYVAAQLRGMML